MFIKEGSDMCVQHISVDEFNNKFHSIYESTQSYSKFYSLQDNLKKIILNDLIQED